MRILLIILFIFYVNVFYGKIPMVDTLENCNSKYFTIGNLQISKNGRWVTIKKLYDNNRDTLMVFDRNVLKVPRITIVKLNQQLTFLNDDKMVVSGSGKAEFVNLLTLKRFKYDKVKQADALTSLDRYFVLDNNNTLSVYSNGDLFSQISAVQNVLTDKNKLLYVIRKENDNSEIVEISSGKPLKLYSTSLKIRRAELMASGSHIVLTEINEITSKIKVTFINILNGRTSSYDTGSSQYLDFVKITEAQQGKFYFIDVQNKMELTKEVPDIWYANDPNLKEKKYGKQSQHQYYIWNTEKETLFKVPDNNFSLFAPIDNPRYLLAIRPQKDFRYSTRIPFLNLYLYDTFNNSYNEISEQLSDIVVSPNGLYIIGFNNFLKKWLLINVNSKEKTVIEQQNLANPIFDGNAEWIYFEGYGYLGKYNIVKKQLMWISETAGKESSVINSVSTALEDQFSIKLKMIDSHQPIVIKLKDSENRTSFISYINKKMQNIVFPTSNNIKEIKFDSDLKQVYTVEENYNMPTLLAVRQKGREKESLLYEGNTKDFNVLSIRQEIISYKNSSNIPLKGILYYPANYDSRKEYPMIVHIYQIQSKDQNIYNYPKNQQVGFDLRTLLDKGYFVYMPDIIFSAEGTGMSALDCVNKSLDALAGYKNINKTKIGLIGHSMGGYETNFIATHSNRFTTYISGSGHSDIVRAYFSYSYDSFIPLLWQFETGQYKMNTSFFHNKGLYYINNPVYEADKVNAPILLWTGTNDENVHWGHTMEFYIALKRSHKDAIALFYPNQLHILEVNSRESIDLNKRILEWWDYFLKDKKDIIWISKQMKRDA